jgi:hypothetical protein
MTEQEGRPNVVAEAVHRTRDGDVIHRHQGFLQLLLVLNLHPQPKALILREVPFAACHPWTPLLRCHLVLMEINYL